MKSALTHLERQFEGLLDQYCFAIESGQLKQAEEASEQAEDYLEAIGVLKLNRVLGDLSTNFG